MTGRPVHLRPTAPVADRVLLPGDPGRALTLAQLLLDAPRMANHHRGLWGYTGTAADGAPLTIQATGMGGPSAAIVLEELATLGVRRAIRVGTCGAFAEGLALGDLVAARTVTGEDGTSRALGTAGPGVPDAALAEALVSGGARPSGVVSTDLFYTREDGILDRWRALGASVVEMEAAALLRVGALRGVAVACALVVSDVLGGPEDRVRIGDEALEAAVERMGRVAAGALGA